MLLAHAAKNEKETCSGRQLFEVCCRCMAEIWCHCMVEALLNLLLLTSAAASLELTENQDIPPEH